MQPYHIEILRQVSAGVEPVTVVDHRAESDLDAYLYADELIRGLNDPLVVGWRLLCMAEPKSRHVRLNYEGRRIVESKRDQIFFAERRAQEAANKAKTERLRQERLAHKPPPPILH